MNSVINYALIACFFIFLTLLYLFRDSKPLLFLKRNGISIDFLTITYRTKRLNSIIERIGKKYASLWKVSSTIGVAIGLILMLLGIYILHINLFNFFIKKSKFAPMTVILPGITVSLDVLPPFLFAATIVFLTHEFAHAFVAVSEKIPIKSFGLLLFTVIFGAFVEPDEDKLNKSSTIAQLRVFSAGTASNFFVYLFFLLLLVTMFTPAGVIIQRTIPGYPAHKVLRNEDIIVAVNNIKIKSLKDFEDIMNPFTPGNTINLTIFRDNRYINLSLRLASSPYNKSKGFMGVMLTDYRNLAFVGKVEPYLSLQVLRYIEWTILISISVAVLNMLPVFALDGGKVMLALLRIKFKRKAEVLNNILSIYFLSILLLNIALSYTIPGLNLFLP